MHSSNDSRVRPVSEAATPEAKHEIARYQSLGVPDSALGVLRDFPGGPETVAISQPGAATLAKLSPKDGYSAIGALRELGADFSLDEELDIVSANPEGRTGPAPDEYLTAVMELRRSMTLDDLRRMRRDAARKPGVRDGLGTRKFREYMDGEVERLGRRYGWSVKLDAPELRSDVHAQAVIFNSFSIGDPDMAGLKELEEKLADLAL